MAEIDFGVEGGVSGKLGNFVLYRVGGKTYLRRRPRRREGAATEKQVRQQSKMAGAMVMHRFVKECELREVFAAWSREVGARSGYNLFLSKNMNAFGEEDYVDYGLLTLAGGSLQLPNELAVTDMADRRLGFAWVDNTSGETARGDDRMLAAVITDDEPYRVLMPEERSGRRQDGQGYVVLPEGEWQTAHVYVFFGAAEGRRYSPGVYFRIEKPLMD